jgi:hypothetical protein
LHASIAPIRRSVDTFDLPDESVTPRSFAELAADVRRISALGQSAKYVQIGAELPGLLDELGAAVHAAREEDRPPLFGLLAEAYSGASAIANLLGYLDLRGQVVERIRWGIGIVRGPAPHAAGALAAHRVPDGGRSLRSGADADGAGPGRPRR